MSIVFLFLVTGSCEMNPTLITDVQWSSSFLYCVLRTTGGIEPKRATLKVRESDFDWFLSVLLGCKYFQKLEVNLELHKRDVH